MMRLCFEPRGESAGGRNVRRARFRPRSEMPVSAACVIANAVRESLGAALATPVSLRLLAPVLPSREAWEKICNGALLYRARGSLADACFVMRMADARALAAAAFGEADTYARDLSRVERELLDRLARSLGGALAHACGRDVAAPERILDISGYTTYFELLLERPVRARLGVALSRETPPQGGPTLRPDDLLGVELEVRAQLSHGALPAAAFLDLRPGVIVPMMTKIGEPGVLLTDGTRLARGECGSRGQRSAFAVCAGP